MKVIIETERLIVREYVEDDAEAFFRLNSDPEVLRFVPDAGLANVEEARKILMEHPIADYRKHGFGRGACILKSTGENIGFAGLKYLEELGEVDVPTVSCVGIGDSGLPAKPRSLRFVTDLPIWR